MKLSSTISLIDLNLNIFIGMVWSKYSLIVVAPINNNLKGWSITRYYIFKFYQLGFINVCKFNKCVGSHEILFGIII